MIISKSTSKTNQNRIPIGLRGAMGGPYPFQSPPRRLYSRAHGLPISMASLWVPEPRAIGPKAQWPPSGGGIHSREGSQVAIYLLFPGVSSQMAPPNTRGPLEVLVGLFTDFSDFLGRLLVIVELHSQLTTCSRACFCFRNRPLERLPHQSCRAFRGEVDSGIPGVFGGF